LHKPRGDGLDPVIDSTGIDDDTALGEPLADVGVAEAVAQLPVDGERDDLIREAVATESGGRSCCYATSTGAAPIHLALLTVPPCFDELLAGTPRTLQLTLHVSYD
jgi:hypothetical protein